MPNAIFGCLKRYKYPFCKICQSILIVINHVFIFRLVFSLKFENRILECERGLFWQHIPPIYSVDQGFSTMAVLTFWIMWFFVIRGIPCCNPLLPDWDNQKMSLEISKYSLGNKIIPDWQPPPRLCDLKITGVLERWSWFLEVTLASSIVIQLHI